MKTFRSSSANLRFISICPVEDMQTDTRTSLTESRLLIGPLEEWIHLQYNLHDEKLPLVIDLQCPEPIPGLRGVQMARDALVEEVEEAILPSSQALPLIYPGEWVSTPCGGFVQDKRLSPKSEDVIVSHLYKFSIMDRTIILRSLNITVACGVLQVAYPPMLNSHSYSPSTPRTVHTVLSLDLNAR
ncbi:hypothetical protein D9757_010535 [Collybiopsis confluens]|uniref:Uncharacterized protein n=1 Tax=Collybiopsis confluens TaxID=2823264 RepID=A0A8H5GP97_9AGAR|nr:hypothetical protein D9757_010535 [Collybiopsis confluens]